MIETTPRSKRGHSRSVIAAANPVTSVPPAKAAVMVAKATVSACASPFAGAFTPAPAIVAALIFFFATSCSTAPKVPEGTFETQNRAAEYTKVADGFLSRGQYESALDFYNQALKANSSVDNIAGVAASRASLGRTYLSVGELDAAQREFEAAAEYARGAAASGIASNAAAGLGEVLYRKGDQAGALKRFDEALVLAAGNEAYKAVALHDRATALAALGRVAEAKADLAKAEAANLKLKRWIELAANRYVLASILAKEGDLVKALSTAFTALEADKRAENGKGIAADLAAIGRLSERLGKAEQAYTYYSRAFDTGLAVGDELIVRKALEALVGLSATLGRGAENERWKALLAKLEAASEAGK